jgi:hypothetical protein
MFPGYGIGTHIRSELAARTQRTTHIRTLLGELLSPTPEFFSSNSEVWDEVLAYLFMWSFQLVAKNSPPQESLQSINSRMAF